MFEGEISLGKHNTRCEDNIKADRRDVVWV